MYVSITIQKETCTCQWIKWPSWDKSANFRAIRHAKTLITATGLIYYFHRVNSTVYFMYVFGRVFERILLHMSGQSRCQVHGALSLLITTPFDDKTKAAATTNNNNKKRWAREKERVSKNEEVGVKKSFNSRPQHSLFFANERISKGEHAKAQLLRSADALICTCATLAARIALTLSLYTCVTNHWQIRLMIYLLFCPRVQQRFSEFPSRNINSS